MHRRLNASCAILKGRLLSIHTQRFSQMRRYLIGAVIALGLDYVVVLAALHVDAAAWMARLLGLLVGVTTTYFFNRKFTFVAKQETASFREWSIYCSMQAVGSALNFSVSTFALYLGSGSKFQIAAAVAAGAVVGFSYNFFAARRVLQSSSKDDPAG